MSLVKTGPFAHFDCGSDCDHGGRMSDYTQEEVECRARVGIYRRQHECMNAEPPSREHPKGRVSCLRRGQCDIADGFNAALDALMAASRRAGKELMMNQLQDDIPRAEVSQ